MSINLTHMLHHFNPSLLVIIIAFMIIGWIVSRKLKKVFEEYSTIPLLNGMTGKQVAEKMLHDNGIYDVTVTCVEGQLTDHYNPEEKTVNLSPLVYEGRSISAAAVAAHECGHAVQHATAYQWLMLRTRIIPIVNFSTGMLNMIYFGMFFLAYFAHMYNQALLLIIGLQAIITLFPLITLPVEIDASRRGLAWLENANITRGEDFTKAKTALSWAAMTYIVAALASITTLLYYILQYSGRRD